MMYSCAPAGRGSSAAVVKKKSRSLRVDIHCHYLNPDAAAKVAPLNPAQHEMQVKFANALTRETNKKQHQERAAKLSSIEVRLKDMDRMGIDVQAVSPAPQQTYYWTDPGMGAELARMVNERLAEIVAKWPDRFVGLGTVPLQDVDGSLDELDRIAQDLRFPGVEICTNVNGDDFDDPRFLPFFERCRDLDLAIVMHPNGFTHGERLAAYYLINTVGMPLDSTVFLARLIFGGVLDRVPDVKMCVVHGGGYLPSYPARYDHAWRERADVRERIPDHPPSTYLKRLHFDTMLYDAYELAILVQRYGADHILLGTDYPYDMGEDDPVELICSIDGLSDTERKLILGGNAARLLNLGS
jgi:aminocarboxymuconate-semialdehyde decarboxylase